VRSRSRGHSRDKNGGGKEGGGEEKKDGQEGGKKEDDKKDVAADDEKKSEDGDVKKEDNEVFVAAEDFSDFGDSDDEILNQEEESREGGELRDSDSRPSSRQSRKSDISGRKGKKADGDDGETDKEQQEKEAAVEKANAQLADALGADWSLLVGDKTEQETEEIGEARKRWTGAEIVRRIGLSERYLGKEAYAEVLEKINKDLPKEEKVELLHPVAGLHMAKMAKREENKRLITGQKKRALSARDDLAIRRRLNGLRGVDSGVPLPPGNSDMSLYKQACTMLKQDQEKQAAYLNGLLAH